MKYKEIYLNNVDQSSTGNWTIIIIHLNNIYFIYNAK